MKKNLILPCILIILAVFSGCNQAQDELSALEPPEAASENTFPAAIPEDVTPEDSEAYMMRIAEASTEELIAMSGTADGAYATAIVGRLCAALLNNPPEVLSSLIHSSLDEEMLATVCFSLGYELAFAEQDGLDISPVFAAQEDGLELPEASILNIILAAYDYAVSELA